MNIYMKKYQCLYNLDMSVTGIMKTPATASFSEKLTKEEILFFVEDAAHTQVDAFLCCPTALRIPLWHSRVLPHWRDIAPYENPPQPEAEWNPSERIYYRIRDYIMEGGNPVDEVYEAVKAAGMDFFFSYRMNDGHFVENENYDCFPTLDTFFTKHPEYKIGPFSARNPVGWDIRDYNQQNYLIPEVRFHYLALLEELVGKYDIDGLELDFMRSPCYFPLDQLEEGTRCITGFVRNVRKMLDKYGTFRGKYLPLSVRVPHRPDYCKQIGFDLPAWDRERLIDMVNVTSSYFHTMALNPEDFRNELRHVLLYGEMQSVMNNYRNEYGWPSERRTPKQIYETTAFHFLQRGFDGVSFFNFMLTREIWQPVINPQSRYAEPPSEVLKHITDMDYLEKQPKYYFNYGYISDDGMFPNRGKASTSIFIGDDILSGYFKHSALRILCRGGVCRNYPVIITVNGCPLHEEDSGEELFQEEIREGQFSKEDTRRFDIPVKILRNCENSIEITFSADGNDVEIFGVELALYIE